MRLRTYPSGRIVNTTYDNAGRVSGVSGGYTSQQKTYVSGFEYEPDGQPYWFHYGNNVCRSFLYDSRLQVVSSTDSSGNAKVTASECDTLPDGTQSCHQD